MLKFDPVKRINIDDLVYKIENSEYFILNETKGGPKIRYSEIFEFYRKSF